MTEAEPVYRAIMVEIERRRLQLGLSHERANDLAGIHDGYLAKMIHADTPSGRQAGWRIVQEVLDAFYPEGFDLVISAKADGEMTRERQLRKMRFAQALSDKRTQRDLMRELGQKGGASRTKHLTTFQRLALSRKGGINSGKARRARKLLQPSHNLPK